MEGSQHGWKELSLHIWVCVRGHVCTWGTSAGSSLLLSSWLCKASASSAFHFQVNETGTGLSQSAVLQPELPAVLRAWDQLGIKAVLCPQLIFSVWTVSLFVLCPLFSLSDVRSDFNSVCAAGARGVSAGAACAGPACLWHRDQCLQGLCDLCEIRAQHAYWNVRGQPRHWKWTANQLFYVNSSSALSHCLCTVVSCLNVFVVLSTEGESLQFYSAWDFL